jgi:hypothetical protein
MVILVPWLAIAVVPGLLSVPKFPGYIGTALMRGKDPFAPHT